MKILFLNAWNGKMREALSEFIKEQSRDTDIFCFQEAYDNMKKLGDGLLPGYAAIDNYKYVNNDDNFAQVTYVKNSIPLVSSGTIMENKEATGLGLYAQIRWNGNDLYVCNFHGMSRPINKLDDEARLKQSETLIGFFKDQPGIAIIGGDFNISPETKSVRMFEEAGYRDLIKDHAIPTTRNRLAWEIYPDNKQYFSDYVFTSPEVSVRKFSVPDLEVADHLPLILEIE